jgi:signal peptidase I
MLLKVIVGGAVLVLAIAILAGRPHFKRYRVPSESMQPTIAHGETVNLNGGAHFGVGDVVIFHAPKGAEAVGEPGCAAAGRGGLCAKPTAERSALTFIKRIVAGPGDQVAFRRGQVIRNGKPVDEPYAASCGDGEACDFPEPIRVPDGMYYLVGDNRGASDDSRFWGPVPEHWILGRVERCLALYFFCSPA